MNELMSYYSKELHDVRPDVVVQLLKRELGVERDDLCAVALAPADVDVAVLDAEEELGGKAGVGEIAHDGHDSGVHVILDGAVRGELVLSEQSGA